MSVPGHRQAHPPAPPPALTAHEAFIDGLALWSPAWPAWPALPHAPGEPKAVATSRGESALPAPAGLTPNERRRAPETVRVALHVAEQAVAMSGHAAATLPSIFTSAHGDPRVIDALLHTLAEAPQLLSPTRFHHAVHNAPAGYWAMASGSHAASTALAAYEHSFGAGLLEALVQLTTEQRPLLLAGCDTEARGALASVNASRGLLGVALVLAPQPGQRTCFALRWQLAPCAEPGTHLSGCTAAGHALARNALADAVPLFETLARAQPCQVALRCGPGLALHVALQPWAQAGEVGGAQACGMMRAAPSPPTPPLHAHTTPARQQHA